MGSGKESVTLLEKKERRREMERVKREGRVLGAIAVFILGALLWSNDGVNRYRKAVAQTFQLFPRPVSPLSGYGMLEVDDPSGADGRESFRWVQTHAMALVRIGAYETVRDLGTTPYPLMVFDASAENGDTPINWSESPRGRHPGNSHDGGVNMDLGYYMTSLKGKVLTPDYAVCTEHYEKGGDGTWKDAAMCLDRADRLDTPRMARFLITLFRIHGEMFNHGLIEEIGIDGYARAQVLDQVRSWGAQKKYGASRAMAEEMEILFTCDAFQGWQTYHHHHIHLRLRDLDYDGTCRRALNNLMAEDRRIESELLRQAGRGGPFLSLSLLSTDLERAVEVELLPTGVRVENLRFRIDGGEWRRPQPWDPRNRAVFEVSPPTSGQRNRFRVEGEFSDSLGQKRRVTAEGEFPDQDSRLQIGIDPERVRYDLREEAGKLYLIPRFPAFYRVLVTGMELRILRSGAREPEVYPVLGPDREIVVENPPERPVIQGELFLSCAGRRGLKIPVYFSSRGGE